MELERVKEALDGLGTWGVWACAPEEGDGFNQRAGKEQKDKKREIVWDGGVCMEVDNQQVTVLVMLLIAGRVIQTLLPPGSGWCF